MLSNPDSIRQAHDELDRVVGSSRTPTFTDEPNLPIIRGMIKETLRMRPINKFGNNHYNIADDWYEAYFIPKGCVIMANWWAIHYDPNIYLEPHTFRPERWYNYLHSAAAAASLADGTQRDHLSYGGGRRICAGIHLAEKSLFINVARLLWGFDIDLAADENGNRVVIDFSTKGLQNGSSSVAKLFACKITPRSEHHERVMRREWSEAQERGVDMSHIKWTV
jgi:cytochrome P450